MGSTEKSSRCPICRARVAQRADNPAFPLCSERCRVIDLGNWLGDAYRVPAGADDGGEPVASDPDHTDGDDGGASVKDDKA